jgi:hypothetical protein
MGELMPVMSTADEKAKEARRGCASLTCTGKAAKDIQITGFTDRVDSQWIGFCYDCYEQLMWDFMRGTAATTVAIMLGVDLSPRQEDDGP